MPDLFSNHENDKAANSCYYKLKLELERIDEEAYSIINSEMDENNDGGLTQKGYEELYGLAEDMKKAMTDNIPTLLRAEKFFSSCFYDD